MKTRSSMDLDPKVSSRLALHIVKDYRHYVGPDSRYVGPDSQWSWIRHFWLDVVFGFLRRRSATTSTQRWGCIWKPWLSAVNCGLFDMCFSG